MTTFENFRQEIEREVTDMERELGEQLETIERIDANTSDNANSLRASLHRIEEAIEKIKLRLDRLEARK